jgi:hypothetical protein
MVEEGASGKPPPRTVCPGAWRVQARRVKRTPLLRGEREIFVCFGFSLNSLLTRSFSPSFGVLQKLSQGRSSRRAEGKPDHGDEAPRPWVHVPAPSPRACPPPSRDREAGTTSQAILAQPNKPLPTSEHFACRPPLASADPGPALPPFCPSLVKHVLDSLTRLRVFAIRAAHGRRGRARGVERCASNARRSPPASPPPRLRPARTPPLPSNLGHTITLRVLLGGGCTAARTVGMGVPSPACPAPCAPHLSLSSRARFFLLSHPGALSPLNHPSSDTTQTATNYPRTMSTR